MLGVISEMIFDSTFLVVITVFLGARVLYHLLARDRKNSTFQHEYLLSNDSDDDFGMESFEVESPKPLNKQKVEIRIVNTIIECIFCISVMICTIVKFYLEDEEILLLLINIITWSTAILICIGSNIAIVTEKINPIINIFHTGEIKKVDPQKDFSELISYISEKRKSTRFLHFTFTFFLLLSFFVISFECFQELFDGSEAGQLTNENYLYCYLLFIKALLIGLLFLQFVGSVFSISKLFYRYGQNEQIVQFLNEIESLSVKNKSEENEEEKTENEKENEEEKNEKDSSNSFLFNVKRLSIEMVPEFGFIIPGMIFIMLEALCAVLVSVLIGVCVSIFTPNVDGTYGIGGMTSDYYNDQDSSSYDDESDSSFGKDQFLSLLRVAGILVAVMCIQSISSGLSACLNGQAAERLAARLRSKTFHSLVAQEVNNYF